jgi:Squalene-hopene cyclase C-terminal domain
MDHVSVSRIAATQSNLESGLTVKFLLPEFLAVIDILCSTKIKGWSFLIKLQRETMHRIIFSSIFAMSFLRVGWALETEAIRTSVERAIPYIQARGKWWIEEKKCVSCHRVHVMLWSLEAASSRGFRVDQTLLTETQNWNRESLLKFNEKTGKADGAQNLEAVSQLVWADRKQLSQSGETETRAKYLRLIREGQQEDGLWKAGGQLPSQKRPAPEGNLVSTMWNALALGTVSQPESQAARQNAMKSILEAQPGESTEAVAIRLLLAVQSKSQPDREVAITDLRKRQRPDGSWSWVGTDESDPLGTGLAIYALRTADISSSDSALANAAKFLVESQTAEGEWKTAGTKTKAEGKPVETSNYWGTCWAVIGLTSLLDPE